MPSKKSVFDLDQYKPLQGIFQTRQTRFGRFWKCYKARATDAMGEFTSPEGNYTSTTIANAVRPLFTPLARTVEIDVALIPGGWKLDPEAMSHKPAMKQIFLWSRWATEGDIFVRYAVSMGEAGLWVRDDRPNNKIILQAVRPENFVADYAQPWDETPRLVLFVSKTQGDGDDEIEEATAVTANRIITYLDGEQLEDRENTLGFVPLVVCKMDVGDGLGEPTFADSLTALDQVNRQASYMSSIIQKHAEPQWAVFGADPTDLTKDGTSVWYFPEGSDVKAILASVDFPGLLAFIQEIKTEMKEGLPELAFAKLVGVERVAAATIELQMAESVFKVRRLRKITDEAVACGMRIAGRVAASMGLAELAGLNDPLFQFDEERAVVAVDAMTRLQIEQAGNSAQVGKLALERERTLMQAQNGGGN